MPAMREYIRQQVMSPTNERRVAYTAFCRDAGLRVTRAHLNLGHGPVIVTTSSLLILLPVLLPRLARGLIAKLDLQWGERMLCIAMHML
jgi:hypothetical protein